MTLTNGVFRVRVFRVESLTTSFHFLFFWSFFYIMFWRLNQKVSIISVVILILLCWCLLFSNVSIYQLVCLKQTCKVSCMVLLHFPILLYLWMLKEKYTNLFSPLRSRKYRTFFILTHMLEIFITIFYIRVYKNVWSKYIKRIVKIYNTLEIHI